jgi:uncharacterized protein (TIGR02996 family)
MLSDTDFLQTIILTPDDNAARLVYADWLEERGDPRGEFIRLQIERSRISRKDPRFAPLSTRESILLVKHEKEWLKEIRRYVKGWRFRRGFVEDVVMGVQQFLAHAEEVLGRAPIQQLKLFGGGKLISRVAKSPYLARLRVFSLPWNRMTDDSATELAACS